MNSQPAPYDLQTLMERSLANRHRARVAELEMQGSIAVTSGFPEQLAEVLAKPDVRPDEEPTP